MTHRTEEWYAAHQKRVKPPRTPLTTEIEGLQKAYASAKPKNAPTIAQKRRGGARRAGLSLPWPPSVNHYWRRNKGLGMHISAEGKRFRDDVIMLFRGFDGVMGRVAVQVTAYPPDNRKRDLDNVFKALLDALSHALIIEDDSMIDDLRITRAEVVKGGRVDVVVESL